VHLRHSTGGHRVGREIAEVDQGEGRVDAL